MERRRVRERSPRGSRRPPGPAEPPPSPRPAELVADLARRLAPEVRGIRVEERREGSTDVLTLSVEGGEVGRIIGRGGRTAQALRSVLGAAAAKHRTKIRLEIRA